MDVQEPPLRVGFVIDTLAPGAGTENQLLLLLRHFDRRSVIPFLCCLWTDPALSLEPGCPTEVLGFRRLVSPEALRGLQTFRAWVRRNRLDVVVTFFRDANLVASLGVWNLGVPLLSSRRNLGRGYWHNWWEIWKLRRLDRLAWGFIANSRAVAEYTREAEGVSGNRIHVVYNAVDSERFRSSDAGERRRCREELGLRDSNLVVICVANLRPIKGVDVLLKAWKRVGAMRRQATLVLVGEGPERAALEAESRTLGTDLHVLFLGKRHDLAPLLRAADIGVLPSRGESFSNALLEYMATGLPSVATAVGGNIEALDTPEVGRLVPPEAPEAMAGAILELAGSETLRHRIGETARDRVVARHGLEVVLARWTEILRRAAGRGVGGGIS